MHDIVKRGGRVVVIDPRERRPPRSSNGSASSRTVTLSAAVTATGDIRRRPRRPRPRSPAGRGAGLAGKQCWAFTPRPRDRTPEWSPTPSALWRGIWRTRRGPRSTAGSAPAPAERTLTTYLIDAVNIVAGNAGQPGGMVFNGLGMPGQRWSMKAVGAMLRRSYEAEAFPRWRVSAADRVPNPPP